MYKTKCDYKPIRRTYIINEFVSLIFLVVIMIPNQWPENQDTRKEQQKENK